MPRLDAVPEAEQCHAEPAPKAAAPPDACAQYAAQAGNQQVARRAADPVPRFAPVVPLLSRAPTATARPPRSSGPAPKKAKGKVGMYSTVDFASNFVYAIDRLTQTKATWTDADLDLDPDQEQLINQLRAALQLGWEKRNWTGALNAFNAVNPSLREQLETARQAGLGAPYIKAAYSNLEWISKTALGGAYHQEHDKAKANLDMPAPDKAYMEPLFKDAVAKFKHAEKFHEEAKKLGADFAVLAIQTKWGRKWADPGKGKAFYELVTLPGSLEDKLAEARKGGYVALAAGYTDLVATVSDSTAAVVESTMDAGAKWAAKQAAKAAGKRAISLNHAAKNFERWADVGKKIGQGANVLAIIAEGIKLVDAISKGDWDSVLDSSIEIGINAAELALGAEGALILPITMTVRATIHALTLISDISKWGQRERARMAAGRFIQDVTKIGQNAVLDFAADVELSLSADQPAVQSVATDKAVKAAPKIAAHLAYLATHLDKNWRHIGSYPSMVGHIGKAREAIRNPKGVTGTPFEVLESCKDVFVGTNDLAKYVQRVYKEPS